MMTHSFAHMPVVCAGETLHLMPEHAVWWPAQDMLLVADVHLGKAAAFRALGQPVPAGTTAATLARLDAALQATGARRLVVLGDLLHSRHAMDAPAMRALAAWRQSHARLTCLLVRGNHDEQAGDPPPELDFAAVDEPHGLGPFALCHLPQRLPDRFVLAGHVHPACVVHGRGRERLRLPCFDVGPDHMVLPAFGSFTGGHTVKCLPGHRHFVVADARVWRLP